jgi:hypothetical protein
LTLIRLVSYRRVGSQQDGPIMTRIHILDFSCGNIDASAKHRREEIIWRKLTIRFRPLISLQRLKSSDDTNARNEP